MEDLRALAFAALRLPPTATPDEIKAAWREAVKVLHPDAGGDPAKFDLVNKAYETLMAPVTQSTATPPKQSPTKSDSNHSTPEDDAWLSWVTARLHQEAELKKYRQWRSNLSFLDELLPWRFRELKAAGEAFEAATKPQVKKSNRVPVTHAIAFCVIGMTLAALGTYGRISGITYTALGIHHGHAVLFQFPTATPTPHWVSTHIYEILPGDVLFGVFIGLLWSWRWTRGNFSGLEQALLGLTLIAFAFAGEFILEGGKMIPIVILSALYLRYAGRLHLPKRLSKVTRSVVQSFRR